MTNENDQDLTRSSQQKLTKYSSELLKKSLALANKVNSNLQNQKYYWASSDFFEEDLEFISSVSISANGKKLAFYSSYNTDHLITIWDIYNHGKVQKIQGEEPINISQDGNFLACLKSYSIDIENLDDTTDEVIIVYNLGTGEIVKSFIINDENFSSYCPSAISPHLNLIAYLDETNNRLVIFDLQTSTITYDLQYDYICADNYNHCLKFSPNGKFLIISNSEYQNACIFHIEDLKFIKTLDLPFSSSVSIPIAINSNCTEIIFDCSTHFNGASIIDISSEKEISRILYHTEYGGASSLAFSLDNKTIVIAYEDGGISIVKAWDTQKLLLSENLQKKLIVVYNLIFMGDFYFSNADYQEANKFYTEAISLDSNNFELYLKRGKSKLSFGDYLDASCDFSKCIMINNKNAESYFYRGIAEARKGNVENVIQDLSMALDIDSIFYENEYLFWLRACAYYDLQIIDKALKDLNKALSLNQNDLDFLSLKGSIHLQLREYQDAISIFDKILEIDFKYKKAYIGRGAAYFDLGNKINALEDLKKVDISDVESGFERILWLRGCSYFDVGNANEAIKDLSYALIINPEYTEALYSRGFIYQNLGYYQQAIEDYSGIQSYEGQ
jgi:tetratricopeptide (TPR) repeat protein